MKNTKILKLISKIGIVVLLVGIGFAMSGVLGFFIERDMANKSIMIGGMALSAIGYLFLAVQNVVAEEL